MAETLSTMLPLGTPLPEFGLDDTVTGTRVTHATAAGASGSLVMFVCNHCPFVKHVLDEIERVAAEYAPRGIGVVAINSNDLATYPQDGPGPMRELAVARSWKFPYLFDDAQEVARAFGAACTPDFFAFDRAGKLAYRGRLDDSRPGMPAPVTGRDLRAALDAILAGQDPAPDQRPSIGCNIKWRAP
jgi:thiol-disulfide isomerase/thioredoxin